MKQTELLKKLNLSTYVALDFETTGLDSDFDRVIEVAAIVFKDGKPKKTFSTLVNPEKNISHEFKSIDIFKASDTMVDSLTQLIARKRAQNNN